jgi:hypothetical protein
VARHLRVPGIVDVVLVSNPAEIRALNDQPKIDHNFIPLGLLMNRFIVGRIRRWFEIMGQLLPSLTPRDDRVRVDRQQQLAAALDSEHESSQGSMMWTDAALARMRALRALPTATSASDDAVLGQCLGRHRSFLRERNYLIPPVAALLQHRTIRLIRARANSVSIRSCPGTTMSVISTVPISTKQRRPISSLIS